MNCNQSPRNVYQCVWEDEPVLMADGTERRIGDVRVGDVVATFHPETLEIGATRVAAHLRTETTKPMFELVTQGGRAVQLTHDHRIFVKWGGENGWASVDEVRGALAGGTPVLAATFAPGPTASNSTSLGFAGKVPWTSDTRHDARAFLAGLVASRRAVEPRDIEAVELLCEMAGCGATVDRLTGDVRLPHTAKETFLRTTGGIPPELDPAAARELRIDVEVLRGEDLADIAIEGDALFVPIRSVTPVPTRPVCDITTESDTHCFLAGRGGGIAVHNSAMGKQAVGVYSLAFNHRMDLSAHTLNMPQQPLVGTNMATLLGQNDLPNGNNVVVAVQSMPQNQEDSVIISRGALDRGLFTSTSTKTYREKLLKNNSTGEEEVLKCIRPERTRAFKNNYDKLGPDGHPPLGTAVKAGDVLIGKVMPHRRGGASLAEDDNSLVLTKNDGGIVHLVHHDPSEIDGEGFKFIKIQLMAPRKPEVGDKFSCYAPDHDVLTADGWVPVAELTTQHAVATLVDDALVYQRPTEVQAYDFDGQMYQVQSNQVDLLVTPNHRMWVKKLSAKAVYEMETAEKVYAMRRLYKKDADAWAPDLADVAARAPELVLTDGAVTGFRLAGNGADLADLVVPIEPWLTFFGVWLAEGCTLRNWGVSIATHKQRVKDAITSVCAEDKLNFAIHKHVDKAYDTEYNAWCMPLKQLVNYIHPLSVGAVQKQIPEWAWFLTRDQCRLLIDGMMLGDGHTMENGTRRYDTSSTKMADQFQRLCLHAGFACNKALKYAAGHQATKKDGYVITSTADAFRLTVITAQNEPKVNKNKTGSGATSAGMQDSWKPYAGKVHCCTVPRGDGIIYVRRNGVVIWSGQSRHGQKGTLGEVRPTADMPATASGVRPDVIINPHALPSRMTIAMVLEMLEGKGVALEGRFGDGTPFTTRDVLGEAGDALEGRGYQRHGDEVLYDGRTGRQIKTAIFVGVAYYQRLKHCAADKIHSRGSNGPVQMLTRQPNEGRARGGGLRMGEMERDCILAQGSSSFLKERLVDASDNFRIFVCRRCGLPAVANHATGRFFCHNRKCPGDVFQIRVPFAFNLMLQELQAIGVQMRLKP